MVLWVCPLNAVLGDSGFTARHGRTPSAEDDEDVRIEAHLLHVADLLRHRWESRASAHQQACISRIESYALAGQFPKHRSSPAVRTPIFIDHLGTPCAVADLLFTFGARDLCEAVDAAHHNAHISEVLEATDVHFTHQLDVWCQKIGLTPQDLAMIQPRYTGTDKRWLNRLVVMGFTSSAWAILMGLAGGALVLMSWPSPWLAEVALAVSCSAHSCFVLVTLVLSKCQDQDNALAYGNALSYGFCFAPIDLISLVIFTVQVAKSDGNAARLGVCAAVWACLLVTLVASVCQCLTYKPYIKMARLPVEESLADESSVEESSVEATSVEETSLSE